MRTPILAMIIVAGGVVATPAIAQQAAPSEQTREQIHQDTDKGLKTTGQASEQMQEKADKGVKTRKSGESGFVRDQDKPGSSANPPGK